MRRARNRVGAASDDQLMFWVGQRGAVVEDRRKTDEFKKQISRAMKARHAA